jgi:hypothetical protein
MPYLSHPKYLQCMLACDALSNGPALLTLRGDL